MNDLETKVVGGLAVAVAGTLGGFVWRRIRQWRRYHSLAGTYSVTKKVTNEPEAELVIKTRGNALKVAYANQPEGDSVNGEIRMTGKTGEGDYTHIKGDLTLWGRWTVKLEPPDEILVERTYTSHKTPEEIVTPFIWRRMGESRDLPDRS